MVKYNEIVIEKKTDRRISAWIVFYHKPTDTFLLAKRGSTVNNPNLWNFFGGGVDPNEKLFKAIKRETKEEAGVNIDSSNITNTWKLIQGIREMNYFLYPVDEQITPKLNYESTTAKWMTPEEWTHLPLHNPTRLFSQKLLQLI